MTLKQEDGLIAVLEKERSSFIGDLVNLLLEFSLLC